MIKVGIVGATGYTGAELLRILCNHPQVEVVTITSRGDAGLPVAELYPGLRGRVGLAFVEPSVEALAACDVVFFATPHCVAMESVPELLAAGKVVIDLSADFRIKDAALWEKWYGHAHTAQEALKQAVYALPEVNREAIRTAQLIACPGCYPTAVQLGFMPLLEAGVIDPANLVANAASGVSGAGRQAKVANLFTEVHDSYKAYGVPGHRHLPEIEQGLNGMSKQPVSLTFVPHLVPMIRGIHATLYATLTDDNADVQALFEQRYANEAFVDVLPKGSHPETRSVKGINTCRLAVHRPQGRNTVVVLSVIDNLTKGAAGQAVQAMNIRFGLDETTGLLQAALMP
ncbi:MAG: N-acetyl-gamma-glutamyl-phosphate reductase [Gammaproteobacteria bacterium]|nr:MAG: N-acetyl-gamma-glutamyl-phosphate reductase [Gammaproteobacteria bacterium]